MNESEQTGSQLSLEDRLAITRGVMNLFDQLGIACRREVWRC